MKIPRQVRLRLPSIFSRKNLYLESPKLSFMFQGRYCFYNVLLSLGLPKSAEVVLPSYHCMTMVEPLVQYGGKFRFYQTRSDLQTEIEDLEKVISCDTRVVFLVHYFGLFQKNTEEIKDYLNARNIILVEDCAHVIPLPNQRVGSIGDMSIFCPRKFVSLIDGALLVINNPDIVSTSLAAKPPLRSELKVIKNTIEQELFEFSDNLLTGLYVFIDRVLNRSRK